MQGLHDTKVGPFLPCARRRRNLRNGVRLADSGQEDAPDAKDNRSWFPSIRCVVGFCNSRVYFASVKPTGREVYDCKTKIGYLVDVGEGEWPLSSFSLSPEITARDFVTIERYVGHSVDFASLVSPMYPERLPGLD